MARKSAVATVRRAAPDNMKAELAALKKERILDAATHLFRRNGYHGTSMDEIAAAIGVTKPFIYYQFRDKQEILAEICSVGARLTLSAVEETEQRDGSAFARMHWFCCRLTEIVVDHGHYLAVYLRELANLDEANHRRVARMRAAIDERIEKLVAHGIASGEFEVTDPAIAARAITLMISYCFQYYRPEHSPPRDAFVAIMADIAMRTLRPIDAKKRSAR